MRSFLLIFGLMSVLITQIQGAAKSHQRSVDDVKPGKFLALPGSASFTIEAKISYGSQDETKIPIVGKFHLPDQSVVEILKEAKLTPGTLHIDDC